MKLTPELVRAAREELAKRKLARATPKLIPVLESLKRYKGAHGGRGSSKSHFYAEMAVLRMVENKDWSIVCIREIQKSLALSAKKLIEGKIQAFKLGHLFEVQQSVIKRRGGTGLCIFQGMQDHTADSIKSLEGFDAAWIEEAQSLSARSLSLLRPTIRKDGSEIWASWNRRKRTDAIDQLLCSRAGERADAIVVHVNYMDNPLLPETLKAEAEDARVNEPDTYSHIWLGAYEEAGSNTVIPYLWIESAIGLAQKLGIEVTGKRYAGLDVAGAEEGGDENALTVRHGIEIVHVEKWNGLDTSATTQRAAKLAVQYGVGEMHYDSAGVGEGVTGEWAAMGRREEQPASLRVIAWNGGMSVLNPEARIDPKNPQSPKNKDHYHNLKAQSWMRLRRRFQNAHAAAQGLPYDADEIISLSPSIPDLVLTQLRDELAQPEQKLSGTGKLMIDKNPDGARSPNLSDSVCIAMNPLPISGGLDYSQW